MPLRCVCGADYNHPWDLTSQFCRSSSQFSDPTQSPERFDPIEGEDWKLGFTQTPPSLAEELNLVNSSSHFEDSSVNVSDNGYVWP